MKSKFLNYIAVAMLLLIPGYLSAQTYKINTEESKVNWLGKKPGGEHNGYVKIKEGELVVEDKVIKGGKFVIDLNSIVNLDLENEGFNSRLVGHLKSADFFDVQKYPTATFEITNVSKLDIGNPGPNRKATHKVEGNLTIKGITKKVSFDASINALNDKFTASTPAFTINRTDWGVNYQSKSIIAGLKDEFIYDDITLSIELVSK